MIVAHLLNKFTHPLRNPQCVFFDDAGPTTGNITVLYKFYLYVFRYHTGRQEILNSVVASIRQIYSTLHSFVHTILICYSRSLICELRHIFEEYLTL
jgi:hypothetical protein